MTLEGALAVGALQKVDNSVGNQISLHSPALYHCAWLVHLEERSTDTEAQMIVPCRWIRQRVWPLLYRCRYAQYELAR